ncbi:MAG: response regulator [Planctomycetaceae bacterium]|nr:response regulator [Planctomycetaceae bacterium]
MDLEPLTVLVADSDDGFATQAARRLAELGFGPLRLERAHSRDDLRRASLRADLDLVLLSSVGDGKDDAVASLRRALAARWRGPLVARLGDAGDTERLLRLAQCARERRRLVGLLEQDSLRYRASFEHAASATFLLSGSGRVLQANPASARLFGCELEELLGLEFAQLFHTCEAEGAKALVERAIGHALTPPEAELHLAARGPAPVVAHALLAPVFDEAGRALLCVLQLTDISARRRAEDEARKKQRIFEAILRVQAQYIRTSDPRAVYGEILKRLQRVTESQLGYVVEVAEEIGTALVLRAASGAGGDGAPVARRGAPLDAALCSPSALLTEALESLEPVVSEGVLLDPRVGGFGANHPPLDNCLCLPIARGRRALAVVVLANSQHGYDRETIDELKPLLATAASVLENLWQSQKRAAVEEALRMSQRALATLMGHLPGMAYRCHDDNERTLEFASDGCIELTGRPAEELCQTTRFGMGALTHPDDRERVLRTVRWALVEKRRFELTWRLLHSAGEERIVWEQGCGVWNDAGELLFVEGFLSDVTDKLRAEEERRRLESRVLHAQKLESLGVLAGGIAHDFNNLLLGILGHAGLAGRRIGEHHPAAESLGQIETAALRAAELADHMLVYTGRGAHSARPVDLSAVVLRARPSLERLLGGETVLELDLAPDLPLVSSDPSRVQELLVHSLCNAAEALEGRGGICIRSRLMELSRAELDGGYAGAHLEAGHFVALEVVDNGPGMDPKVLARAADPFFTTKEAGRGLGLSTVLGAVRAHGGALKLESRRGEGTTVRLIFPVLAADRGAATDGAPQAVLVASREGATNGGTIAKGTHGDTSYTNGHAGETTAPHVPGSNARPTVLVVDDEALVRDLARALLEDAGYEVLAAEDGERGVELFRSHGTQIAAVLLDLTMPRLDGEGTLAAIREMEPAARVLLTSGYSEHDAMHRIASRAGVEFLQKPWRLDDLLGRLKDLIGR